VLGKKRCCTSTDLSHFYPQHIAETLDAEVLRRVEALILKRVAVEEKGKVSPAAGSLEPCCGS